MWKLWWNHRRVLINIVVGARVPQYIIFHSNPTFCLWNVKLLLFYAYMRLICPLRVCVTNCIIHKLILNICSNERYRSVIFNNFFYLQIINFLWKLYFFIGFVLDWLQSSGIKKNYFSVYILEMNKYWPPHNSLFYLRRIYYKRFACLPFITITRTI